MTNISDENELKAIAAQLRQPHGDFATMVGEKMNEGNKAMNLRMIEALALTDNDSILEIGMGNGHFVPVILSKAKNIRYQGCDFSEAMIREAIVRNNMFIESGQAAFHLSNVRELPFADQSFNKICTANTIYFWDDPAVVLNELNRVLQQNGIISLALRPKREMQTYPMTKYGFTMYDMDDVVVLLEKNSFKVIHTEHNPEPDREIGGTVSNVSHLVIVAEKGEKERIS